MPTVLQTPTILMRVLMQRGLCLYVCQSVSVTHCHDKMAEPTEVLFSSTTEPCIRPRYICAPSGD